MIIKISGKTSTHRGNEYEVLVNDVPIGTVGSYRKTSRYNPSGKRGRAQIYEGTRWEAAIYRPGSWGRDDVGRLYATRKAAVEDLVKVHVARGGT